MILWNIHDNVVTNSYELAVLILVVSEVIQEWSTSLQVRHI